MSQILRDLNITQGHNYIALSAEHELIGIWREQGTIWLTLTENTKLSDAEEGLVYRDIYLAIAGEVLSDHIVKDALGHDLLPGDGLYRTMTAFYLPASKDTVVKH